MAEPTYKGTDGEMRTLEAHRAHLQSELDQAVDPESPRYDEDFVGKLRVQLRGLPRPVRPQKKPQAPELALVLVGDDAAAVEAFLAAGPDSAHEIIASGRKKLKPTHLHRRVLRALLSAKIERR